MTAKRSARLIIYSGDRIFVYLRLRSAPDAAQDQLVEALERAGHPVMRIAVDDPYDLGEDERPRPPGRQLDVAVYARDVVGTRV